MSGGWGVPDVITFVSYFTVPSWTSDEVAYPLTLNPALDSEEPRKGPFSGGKDSIEQGDFPRPRRTSGQDP